MIGSGEGLDGGGGGGASSLVATQNPPVETIFDRNFTASDAIREALRQTEMRITEQVSMSLAADQRAMTFAGLLMVVFVLLVGASTPSKGILSDISVALLFVSTLLSVYSAKPMRLYGTGSSSISIRNYLAPEYAGYTLSALVARNDEAILKNDKAVRGAAFVFRIALVGAFFAFASVAIEFWIEKTELAIDVKQSGEP